MRLALTLSLAVLFAGCSCGNTHSARDGAVEEDAAAAGCPGPMPVDCFEFISSGDCRPVTARCEGTTWNCPRPPPGAVCETIEECMFASNPELVCHATLGRDCCGEEVPRYCDGRDWACFQNATSAADCGAMAPACEGCEGLGQAACLGEPSCVPAYVDACCERNCDPTFPCDGCLDYSYGRCERRAEACDRFFCTGTPYDGLCESTPIDCTDATPTNEAYCDVPGCVVAIESGCSDDCDTCVPVEADSCSAECDQIPPPCPTGMIARASGGCYTGDCIQAVVCAAPD